jgi:predicted TIM-barrel fold metal-dependent hydrolase
MTPTTIDSAETPANGFIDCDVHIASHKANGRALADYLPARWRDYQAVFGATGYQGRWYPRPVRDGVRGDAFPDSGGPAGSDFRLLRDQLLDRWDVRYAILSPAVLTEIRNLDHAAALAAANNEWVVEQWLDRDPRLRASMAVPYWDPPAAVRELERARLDSRFVQVYLHVRTRLPFGNRMYWPLYEAAEAHGLPLGIHLGGADANPISGAGWPSYYVEEHVGMAQRFAAHVISLVFEGVFERFPGLKIVLIEGGVAWLAPLAWRMDRAWQLLGSEVPEVRRPPSEYVADHFWLTTQPIEEPPEPAQFARLFQHHPKLAERLMFSTDYPHWDFDNPDHALRKVKLPPGASDRIKAVNAAELYHLPLEAP